MTRRRSVTIDVDGKPVRLCGGTGEMTDEAAAAITDLVRAATRLLEQQPALCRAREDGRIMPCLRELDHEPPHRTGSGREWT